MSTGIRAFAHVAPDATLAQMHRGMAEPGSGKGGEPKSKRERKDRPRVPDAQARTFRAEAGSIPIPTRHGIPAPRLSAGTPPNPVAPRPAIGIIRPVIFAALMIDLDGNNVESGLV